MAFFEPPPPPPVPEPQKQPLWLGPSGNVVGVAVPVRLVLARTDEAAVVVDGLAAFPSGFELVLSVRVRAPRRQWSPLGLWREEGHVGLPDDVLRFGIELANGRKATTLSGFPDPGEAEGPVLIPRDGTGGVTRWDQRYWVWPLPPPGPLAFVCEWPAEGISLTRAEIDAGLVLEAAARAEILWDEPEGPAAGEGGWVAYPG